ncbi:MAG: sigma-70 family RNA polymerase sigma factor [Chitinophagales bacterium]|nr:sigma-70 family RNA polymerase sigma factor [Chitinophagales bacterium]
MSRITAYKMLADAELISKYKQTSDNRLVGELYERYMHLVYGVCLKYLGNAEDSRDATIEIFEKLLEDLKKHDVEHFKSWLYSVAKNHCLMKFRKDKLRVENHPELQQELISVMEWDENVHLIGVVSKEEKLENMEAAIQQLSYNQKQCIELFYLKDRSYQEIMSETGFDFGQVKSFIQNGKRNLKLILTRKNEPGQE